jgi:hypothetical protein
MRAVQQQAPPAIGRQRGDHYRRAVRGLTTDRLTIPGGELDRTTEIHTSLLPGSAGTPDDCQER